MFCKTCGIAYCCRCILKDHNLHVFEDTKDMTQLNQFYQQFNEKVDAIKEKQSFAENTLKKFETIESHINLQKEECVQKIKTIINKLQEKVTQLGNNLLERVDTICHKKEQVFDQKKSQLMQMTDSFKFIQQFMSAIMAMNDPMSLMKTQDLLISQVITNQLIECLFNCVIVLIVVLC